MDTIHLNGIPENEDDLIKFYPRKYYVFCNFSSFAVEWQGALWMTPEHAYQAAHFDDPEIIETIKNARSAHDAKKLMDKYQDRKLPNWHDIKLDVMEDILRAKLAQHPYVKKKLLETGDKYIVENSPKDSFWGWGPNKDGHNHLGKIWMKLRSELQARGERAE